MKKIQLSNGMFTLVDDVDYKLFSAYRWSVNAYGYAKREQGNSRQPGRKILFLHREIFGAQPGEIIDHINGDRLDNRRQNLRHATQSENLCNRGPQSNNTSGYKGVSQRQDGRWLAQIQKDGQHSYIGLFSTAEEAALAYKERARSLHGEFAYVK